MHGEIINGKPANLLVANLLVANLLVALWAALWINWSLVRAIR
jgi:hypothetical protein